MQKLRCPRCGAINLEGFVTYPQCAGCGNTLPQPSQGREPVWKRPMGPLLGVSFLAVALTAALGAAGYFQSENNSQGQAILHGNASREGRVGDIIFVALMVDAVTESREQRRQPLNDVRLHLPLKMFKALRFVSIEPKPDTMTLVGNGRYFHYETLGRESTLVMRLRAVTPGRQRFRAALYIADHTPSDWRVTVRVHPANHATLRSKTRLR